MRKLCCLLLCTCIMAKAFGQELTAAQIKFNGTVFTLGKNTYEKDLDLIANTWYRGHTSASKVKPGEPVDWINSFTGKYEFSKIDYDISVYHELMGTDCHSIKFSETKKDGTYFILIYNPAGILSYVHIKGSNDISHYKGVKFADSMNIIEAARNKKDYSTKDYYLFVNNVLYEPEFELTSYITVGLTGLKISLLESPILEKLKNMVNWTIDYEARTGKPPSYEKPEEKLAGLKLTDSSIRIAEENKLKEQMEREEQKRQRIAEEQARREEAERQRQARQEEEARQRQVRKEAEERQRLEEQQRAEEQRIQEEQAYREALNRSAKKTIREIRLGGNFFQLNHYIPMEIVKQHFGGSLAALQKLGGGNKFTHREKRNSISLLKDGQEVFTLTFGLWGGSRVLSKITIVPENAYDIIEEVAFTDGSTFKQHGR